jgi:hypothetical protein
LLATTANSKIMILVFQLQSRHVAWRIGNQQHWLESWCLFLHKANKIKSCRNEFSVVHQARTRNWTQEIKPIFQARLKNVSSRDKLEANLGMGVNLTKKTDVTK